MGSRGIAKRHNKTEAPQGLENLGEMYQAAFDKDR